MQLWRMFPKGMTAPALRFPFSCLFMRYILPCFSCAEMDSGEYHSTYARGPCGHEDGSGLGPSRVSNVLGRAKITLTRPILVPARPMSD